MRLTRPDCTQVWIVQLDRVRVRAIEPWCQEGADAVTVCARLQGEAPEQLLAARRVLEQLRVVTRQVSVVAPPTGPMKRARGSVPAPRAALASAFQRHGRSAGPRCLLAAQPALAPAGQASAHPALQRQQGHRPSSRDVEEGIVRRTIVLKHNVPLRPRSVLQLVAQAVALLPRQARRTVAADRPPVQHGLPEREVVSLSGRALVHSRGEAVLLLPNVPAHTHGGHTRVVRRAARQDLVRRVDGHAVPLQQDSSEPLVVCLPGAPLLQEGFHRSDPGRQDVVPARRAPHARSPRAPWGCRPRALDPQCRWFGLRSIGSIGSMCSSL